MIIRRFVVGDYLTNTYLLISGKDAILIDAGQNPVEVIEYIKAHEIKLNSIYATHGHFDHVLGVTQIKSYFDVPFYIHEKDEELMKKDERTKEIKIDGFVKEGDVVKIGEEELRVIETPGHTLGSVCYLLNDGIFTGDTLFNNSIGRYDIGGDKELLKKSLKRLTQLDDGLTVYPGHGLFTTLGYEKITNPFINGEFDW